MSINYCECGRCSKAYRLEDACWVRITDSAGGKIEEKPVCGVCAWEIAKSLKGVK